LRIAFTTGNADGLPLHPDCREAVLAAAKLCEQLGHTVEEAAAKIDRAPLVVAFMAAWTSNLAAGIDGIARLTGQTPQPDLFEGLTWGLYEAGKRITASEYLLAKTVLQRASRQAAQFHETYDVWLTATLGRPPIKLGTFDLEERDPVKSFAPIIDYVPFTAMQNVTGQPAINIPLHWNGDGLPIGVQCVGRFGDELTLLQLAAELETAEPWWHKYASIQTSRE
jgi:amidase